MTRDDGASHATPRWRMFIALPVPPVAATAIHDALASMRREHADARWLHPDLYHVTLRFLGSVEPAVVPALATSLHRLAGGQPPLSLTAGRGGGTSGRSSVAWLSLPRGARAVTELADRLDRLLPADLRATLPQSRPAPHLTVARHVPPGFGRTLRSERLEAIRVAWVADRVVLFRSHTGTPAGSTYEVLAEARLGARAAA